MGRIDVLVNNVGVEHGDANALALDVASWQLIMDINLRAMWLTSRAVVPLMQEQRGGAITNISSLGSRTGSGPFFAYGISKAGVDAVTHSFAVTYAPWGIRCNSVLPAWVVTAHSMEGLKQGGLAVSEEEYYAVLTSFRTVGPNGHRVGRRERGAVPLVGRRGLRHRRALAGRRRRARPSSGPTNAPPVLRSPRAPSNRYAVATS